MGTVHLLEAARQLSGHCTIIGVTTDKCYENREWVHSYREEDPMGGHDPYSSSKGAAELVIAAYRRSYFSSPNSAIRLASARAGNVIGGGDWALDRIVPDCIRALSKNESIVVRNKVATRPWQHVLEPLSGYLWLGAQLSKGEKQPPALASGFNF
jgi:CDP-glucose 4,6-dehydratase